MGKWISQLDADGVFVGEVMADESPLEPGVFLIPGGAVDAAAPQDVPVGQRARWVNGDWLLEALPPGTVLPPWVPPTPAQLQADALRQVDADADAIVRDVVGGRAEEYRQAEAEAQAFEAAGFTGEVPGMVAVWAQASGMTAQAAAQDILAQSAAWRGALLAIRQARLTAKAVVRSGDVNGALATWGAFVVAIRLQLGV